MSKAHGKTLLWVTALDGGGGGRRETGVKGEEREAKMRRCRRTRQWKRLRNESKEGRRRIKNTSGNSQ